MSIPLRLTLTISALAVIFQQALLSLSLSLFAAPPRADNTLTVRAALLASTLSRFGPNPPEIRVRVEDQSLMPYTPPGEPKIIAHATKSKDGRSCNIHMTRSAIEERDGLAHEVCHCVLDFDLMGEHGYLQGTTKAQKILSEERAETCGQNLALNIRTGWAIAEPAGGSR